MATNADGHDWWAVAYTQWRGASEFECQRCGMRQPIQNIGCIPPHYGPCSGTRQTDLPLDEPPIA